MEHAQHTESDLERLSTFNVVYTGDERVFFDAIDTTILAASIGPSMVSMKRDQRIGSLAYTSRPWAEQNS